MFAIQILLKSFNYNFLKIRFVNITLNTKLKLPNDKR